ncbi:MAG TPA: MMPL family transporter [Mycobacteriales bacterium]|nr:MMPL family transporter [Mycobacteriales bacterium]
MKRLAEFVLRHRKLVCLAWLVLFIAGASLAGKTTERLVLDFSLPGQPGSDAAEEILDTFGNGGELEPVIATLTFPTDVRGGSSAAATSAFAAVQRDLPLTRVVSSTADEPLLLTDDGRTAYAFVFTRFPESFDIDPSEEVKVALAKNTPAGATSVVTGYTALAYTDVESGESSSVLSEALLAGLGALAVLLFVFASFLALLPLVVAAVSIMSTFLAMLVFTTFMDVNLIVQFLAALIGLGVAIDYSLLIVTRWREERAHGRDNHDAVVVATETAGHAVVFSGVTVAIGLVALAVLPVPFLRSMGIVGMLIPLISVLASVTLLPAILGGIGPRVDWPRIRKEGTASHGWTRWAAFVVRRRWWVAAGALAILGVLLAPLSQIKIGLPSTDSLASAGPAFEAFEGLKAGGVVEGTVTPMEVIVDAGREAPVAAAIRAVDGVAEVIVDGGSASTRDGMSVLIVIPERQTVDNTSLDVVREVRKVVTETAGARGLAGIGPGQVDFSKAVYGNFPLVFALIILLTYILLVRAFRSLLLPLKAVAFNLLSIAATFGAVVWFWQLGNGSEAVFGIAPTGAITFWIPLMVFAFLYGLSMDYEVFILARVREEYDASASTDTAIIEGVGRTGRLVTSAALILFLSFGSLASAPGTDNKLFATALGFGILLDATVVRSLLVPSLVSLMGAWNWYLPTWAARILRVEPSLPHAEVDRRVPVSAG